MKYTPVERFAQTARDGAKNETQTNDLDLEGEADLMLLIQEHDSASEDKSKHSQMSVADIKENIVLPSSSGRKQTSIRAESLPLKDPSSTKKSKQDQHGITTTAQERQKSASIMNS